MPRETGDLAAVAVGCESPMTIHLQNNVHEAEQRSAPPSTAPFLGSLLSRMVEYENRRAVLRESTEWVEHVEQRAGVAVATPWEKRGERIHHEQIECSGCPLRFGVANELVPLLGRRPPNERSRHQSSTGPNRK